MTLKTIATGSTGNCYVLTNGNGEHLLLDAGIPIKEIKQGIEYDVENLKGAVCTHTHADHHKAVKDLKNMGIPVWQPYLSKHKRQRTHLGDFECESFELPHNGCPNVGYLIRADYLTIVYLTDMEYCKWDLRKQKINVALIEMNYQQKIMDKLDIDSHITHTVLGHASDKTTTEILVQNKAHLQNVILCHYSKSENLNREEALAELKTKLPKYINIQYAIPGEEITLGCPF